MLLLLRRSARRRPAVAGGKDGTWGGEGGRRGGEGGGRGDGGRLGISGGADGQGGDASPRHLTRLARDVL